MNAKRLSFNGQPKKPLASKCKFITLFGKDEDL